MSSSSRKSTEGRSDAESTNSKYSEIDIIQRHLSTNPHEHLEPELQRLSNVLKFLDPIDLQRYLIECLKGKDHKILLALSHLLPSHKFPVSPTVHCVRCHHEYNPLLSCKKFCLLYHSPRMVEIVSQDDNGTTFKCCACDSQFYLNGVWKYTKRHQQLAGTCFQGTHTDDTYDVSYRPHGVAKTCQDNGCIEFYV